MRVEKLLHLTIIYDIHHMSPPRWGVTLRGVVEGDDHKCFAYDAWPHKSPVDTELDRQGQHYWFTDT